MRSKLRPLAAKYDFASSSDEVGALVIEDAAVRRIERTRRCDHLRLDLDRRQMPHVGTAEQKVRRHPRALADDRDFARVGSMREGDDRQEDLRRDVVLERVGDTGERRAVPAGSIDASGLPFVESVRKPLFMRRMLTVAVRPSR